MSRKKDDGSDLLPSTYLAVLSLIGGGAQYGYEINQIIKDRGYRNWVDISMQSVYKALKKLENWDPPLIQGEKSDESLQPSKKTWILTKEGSRLLKKQIKLCLSDPPREKSMFDLGMSAIFLLTRNEALKSLQRRIDNLEESLHFFENNIEGLERLEEFRETEPDRLIGQTKVKDMPKEGHYGVVHSLFERPYARVKCEKEWLEKVVDLIEKGKGGFMFRDSPKGK